jgi:oligogalacturonide lyase
MKFPSFCVLLASFVVSSCGLLAQEPPTDWIDPDTGHRIVRLSREAGSGSLYFHQNGYTPEGDKLIITSPSGISVVDLKTLSITPVVQGKVWLLFTGRKTRSIYYTPAPSREAMMKADGMPPETVIYVANIDTRETRELIRMKGAQVSSINADETLLLCSRSEKIPNLAPGKEGGEARFGQPGYEAKGPDGKPLTFAESKEVMLYNRLEARIPMEIFTVNIKTGESKVIHKATDWLNHLQFSPTDPNLIMFCHEGPWHRVDRIWTIRTDGTGLTKIHTRTMNMEIAGHEFFSADGKTIWYDLQTPRGEDFWVGGYELATGRRTWYHLQRDEWSVHFNVSPDGKLFAGDGGDSEMVAHAKDGKWIYLFRPEGIPDVAGIHAEGSESLIVPGYFKSERLVNMSKHDYRLEPNITFTPDMKWLVFRSNMHGVNHVYAVEIAKSK